MRATRSKTSRSCSCESASTQRPAGEESFSTPSLTRSKVDLTVNIKDKEHVVINRVRELRLELALTQDELASEVNATRQTIVAIEKGNYVPSVLLALRLSEVLGRSVEEVFSYEKR